MKSKSGYPTLPSSLSAREKRLGGKILKCFSPEHWVQSDMILLEAYIKTHYMRIDAQAMVEQQGMVLTGSKGAPVRNPYVQIARDMGATLASLSTKLKISPSSRLVRRENITTGIQRVKDEKVFQGTDPAGNSLNADGASRSTPTGGITSESLTMCLPKA